MIFDPAMADLVVCGRKTVTRRPADGKPCGHRVGSIQKVQPGQGQPAALGRLHILSIALQPIEAITDADARREGYGGRHPRAKFVESWLERYPDAGYACYRIEFEYLSAS